MKTLMMATALGLLALAPQATSAEDLALIVVESDYRRLPDAAGAQEAAALAAALDAAGFRVVSSLDQEAVDAWRAVAEFRAGAAEADRLLVLLSGHFVSTARESYLLTRYAEAPDDLSVGGEAVPLGPVFDVLASRPGQAVALLAPSGYDLSGAGLMAGAAIEAPQGVTVLSGPVQTLAGLARGTLLVPGAGLATALGRAPGVAAAGFVTDAVPFLPAPAAGAVVIERPGTPDMDTAFWQVAVVMGSVEGYEAYLKAYPTGRFAEAAQVAITRIVGNAEAQAQAAEAALGLDRDARQRVQRDLSLLGFNPRGIDGIFGPGSRAAISAWQGANGFEASGYLTAQQVRSLSEAAARRAAELEAEAAARKAEEERQDTAYWRATGQGRDEAGLRAYLGRYPDGLFADVAEARLAEIEAQKRAAAAAEERDFWDRVRAEDTADAYRGYLQRYPKGAFAQEAQDRLDEITAEDNSAAVKAAKAEEAQIAGNGVTRLLVENRLQAAGFDPGRADGVFNNATRRAIRRFQKAQGIAVTGYVSQETMVRLLAVR